MLYVRKSGKQIEFFLEKLKNGEAKDEETIKLSYANSFRSVFEFGKLNLNVLIPNC